MTRFHLELDFDMPGSYTPDDARELKTAFGSRNSYYCSRDVSSMLKEVKDPLPDGYYLLRGENFLWRRNTVWNYFYAKSWKGQSYTDETARSCGYVYLGPLKDETEYTYA